MCLDEINEVKEYLIKIIEKEKLIFDKRELSFYYKNKINFIPIFFENFYDEYFFVILKFNKFYIYYNDIEEIFGICEINNGKVVTSMEFFDDLYPTIKKLHIISSKYNNLSEYDKLSS